MVSIQESISSTQRKITTISELFADNSNKKRRWEDNKQVEDNLESHSKSMKFDHLHDFLHQKPSKSFFFVNEDLKFYNTKDNKEMKLTLKDPCRQHDQEIRKLDIEELGQVMSLDLELNLHSNHYARLMNTKTYRENETLLLLNSMSKDSNSSTTSAESGDRQEKPKNSDKSATTRRFPSWVSLEEDDQEMVAAACMKCHMLVMLSKASPSCPNCKFMHPLDHQSSISLFKPRISSLSWKS